MKEISPGVYQLPLPFADIPLNAVNTYLIKGKGEYLLIDTGWNNKNTLASLERQLFEAGASFHDITQVVITHEHPDHYGLVGKVKQLSGAKVTMHYLEQETIKRRYHGAADFLLALMVWLHRNGLPDTEMPERRRTLHNTADLATPILADAVLRGGEIIDYGDFHFQVLWTPGHAAGHISLYEPAKRLFFSGDFILPTITPNIPLLDSDSPINPLGDYLNALKRVRDLPVEIVLPAHGCIFNNLSTRVDELIRHHAERIAEIVYILRDSPQTGYDVARRMTWDTDQGGKSWTNLMPWDKAMATLETLAHLEAMRHEGRLSKTEEKANITYQLA